MMVNAGDLPRRDKNKKETDKPAQQQQQTKNEKV